MHFSVWAPRADVVALVLTDREVELNRAGDGWFAIDWCADDAATGVGVDYGFRLDHDDQVLPDPRSRWQPEGVHGRSRRFDPDAHPWADSAWTGRPLAGGLVYELHLGTFTAAGTLDGAAEKLDHLVDLGVTHVELLPVNAFSGEHNWGYDGVGWYAVDESYGGPAGYQRFVDACHSRGLAVIQDVVYNHLGPTGNYLPRFGPYLHEGRSNTWGDAPNLDGPESPAVRRFIIENALMWLRDYHVDSLRLDAVHALVDLSAVHLLEELAAEVDALAAHVRRPLTLIAESDQNDPRLVTPREAGGFGLHAQWDDDFHHVLHVALTGEKSGYYEDFGSVSAIAKVLQGVFFHDGTRSTFRGRSHGRPVDRYATAAWRFVVCLQNHDQIGNRATGDRLPATLGPDRLAVGATLLFTSPFTPMLFMGEEWAAGTPWQFFTSHPEPQLAQATAEGRITEFARMGWDPAQVPDPQDPETFLRSKLNWAESEQPAHAAMLETYRRLAALRRAESDLTDPRLTQVHVVADDDAGTLWVRRGAIGVAANLSDQPRAFPAADPAGAVLFSTVPLPPPDGPVMSLPPWSAVVLRLSDPIKPS